MKKLIERVSVFGVGVLSLLYLLNIGAGIFEFIPDNFPVLGNLDEAAATSILLGALAYFGFDVTRFFRRAPSAKDGGPVIEIETEPVATKDDRASADPAAARHHGR